jgi:hypothetical protein
MFKILKSIFGKPKVVIVDDDGTCKLIEDCQINGARKSGTNLFRSSYQVEELPAVLNEYSEINYN